MIENIEISGHPDGAELLVRTPGRYAMDVAIDVLKFLDEQGGISVKNTGWKNGFEIEVCSRVPIYFGTLGNLSNLVAELDTDGEELHIRRTSGSLSEFEDLFKMVVEFLNEKPPNNPLNRTL